MSLDLIINAFLIFFIFLLICLLGQFFRFMDNKKDKRNLIKLQKECPEAFIIVKGKILNVKKMIKVSFYINDKKRSFIFNEKDVPNKEFMTIKSTDEFNENIEIINEKEPNSISVRIREKETLFRLAIDVDGDSAIIDSPVEYKKGKRIELIKRIGISEYLIKQEDEKIVSFKDKTLGNDVLYLLQHEKEIMDFEDSFNPNMLLNSLLAAGLTVFVVLATTFVA